MATNLRIGTGYDRHPLAKKRKLILGGVEIPFNKGLDGWSDADVLTHAVIDALLGAAALGDIGGHFPPGQAQYKDISSLTLLKEVGAKLAAGGWGIVNIDANIIAEQNVPVLDGMGPVGAKDHSKDEYIFKESLLQRSALLTCSIVEIWQKYLRNDF